MASLTHSHTDGDDESAKCLRTDWKDMLPPEISRFTIQQKLYLIFSLIIHLNITITVFLEFMFSCKHPSVKRRVSQFTSYTDHGYDVQFAPYTIRTLMKSNFPSAHTHLVDLIVIPKALEKGRSEFRKAIRSDRLRLKVDKLTRIFVAPVDLIEIFPSVEETACDCSST